MSAPQGHLERLTGFGLRNRDIGFAVGVTAILAVLFVPLPPLLLDLGLAVSLSLSVLILMVALWIPRPLDFNSFPTLLLVVTMLRLALNIASTRLILGQGHTGTGQHLNVVAQLPQRRRLNVPVLQRREPGHVEPVQLEQAGNGVLVEDGPDDLQPRSE